MWRVRVPDVVGDLPGAILAAAIDVDASYVLGHRLATRLGGHGDDSRILLERPVADDFDIGVGVLQLGVDLLEQPHDLLPHGVGSLQRGLTRRDVFDILGVDMCDIVGVGVVPR